jgi:hypothetical protein
MDFLLFIFFFYFSGQSMIVELIAHSCQLHKEQFDASDEETADRLIHCANAALPYFSVSSFLQGFPYPFPI